MPSIIFVCTMVLSILSLCVIDALEELGNEGLLVDKIFIPAECDRRTKLGDRIYLRYTGSIDETSVTGERGKVFDSNVNRPTPLEMYIGKGSVIQGWDVGTVDMCVGEKRILIIPPVLGYGDRGFGRNIPGGATLRFHIELISITNKPAKKHPYFSSSDDVFSELDYDEDGLVTFQELIEYMAKRRLRGKHKEIFEAEDRNKDGVISHEEFSGPKKPSKKLSGSKVRSYNHPCISYLLCHLQSYLC